MNPWDIAKALQSLQNSSKRNPNSHEWGKSGQTRGRNLAQKPEKKNPLPEEKQESKAAESRGKSIREAQKRLERENQFLVKQLVTASALIRDLQSKHYEASHKQREGKMITAGLLHDLRNPLGVISSCAQFCLDNLDLDSSVQEKIQTILENSRKAQDLTRQFLDYTKTSLLDFKPIKLNQFLLAIWKMSKMESAPSQVSFETRLDKHLPEIMASRENLERVFLNLFMNAIHAVSKKGKVILETRLLSSRDKVEIKIIDNGKGISKEQQERIFEPFYTTKENGTGLGLSICQSIIHQHKGTIAIESQVGKGTTVTVLLPVSQSDSSPETDKEKGYPKSRTPGSK
jgi:two-component system, NtrC family, sensor histidine kinase AtoS